MSLQQTDRYDDIINLPHHRSRMRPHMSIHNRAAQFMPMGHSERYSNGTFVNVPGEKDQPLFAAGVEYFTA